MDVVKIFYTIFDLDDIETHDPRTREWLTVKTPIPVLLLNFLYIYFVLKWGPSYMKNREPYDLKTFIKGYNMYQIIANAALVYYMIQFGLFTEIPLTCVSLDYSTTGNPMKLAILFWYLWLSKTSDFIETITFVLRKKNKQITFLHLYHHITTMLFTWALLKVLPGGVITVHAAVNCFIHVIMYSYYLASSFGPEVQRKISPFKRYVTIMQMVQFVFLILHSLQGYDPSCDIPRHGVNMVILNLTLNFVLFFNFYRKAYWQPKKTKSS